MAAPTYYTAEMVRALPEDGNRYETVHGELLVTPAPRWSHQRLVGRLYRALAEYLDAHPIGEALISPADISFAPDMLVQPDVFVAPIAATGADDWAGIRRLLLAVEVVSPSTARYDRFTKRRLYQEVGVPTYWIVDGEERSVEVWTPAATLSLVVCDALVWAPAVAAEPFTLSLERLFRPA